MASQTTRPNGHTWITVKAANGKRRHVRLGSLSPDQAAEAKRRLAQAERHYHQGEPLDAMTLAWLGSIPSDHRKRVQATGLVPDLGEADVLEAPDTSVGRLIVEWWSTLSVAPSTEANYRQTTALVRKYFGGDRCVKTIVPADADKFVAWMAAEGRVKGDKPMSRASVSRGSRTVRAIFEFGVRLRWLADNPFMHVRSQGEVNEDRWWYVTPALVDAIVDRCADPELRAMIALSRYATFRGPSEFGQLRWQDIDWSVPSIKITAPKTNRYVGGLLRVSPLEGKALLEMQSLWDRAEGDPEVFPRLGGASSSDLSSRVEGLCRKIGVALWEKPWTNMRASCETDWQRAGHQIFDTSEWMGHSPEVALKHYKRVASHIADLPAVQKGEALRLESGQQGEAQSEALRGSLRECRHSQGVPDTLSDSQGLSDAL